MIKVKTLVKTKYTPCVLLIGAFFYSAAIHADANPTPRMCFKSVDSIETYISNVKHIAETRFNARAISRGEYTKYVDELNGIEVRFSLEKCMTSKGEELAVFQCLAGNNGNYPLCQK